MPSSTPLRRQSTAPPGHTSRLTELHCAKKLNLGDLLTPLRSLRRKSRKNLDFLSNPFNLGSFVFSFPEHFLKAPNSSQTSPGKECVSDPEVIDFCIGSGLSISDDDTGSGQCINSEPIGSEESISSYPFGSGLGNKNGSGLSIINGSAQGLIHSSGSGPSITREFLGTFLLNRNVFDEQAFPLIDRWRASN